MVESATSMSTNRSDTAPGFFTLKNLVQFGAVVFQVVLVALMFKAVRLESEAFRQLLFLVAAAFPIHHILPQRFRLPFFVVFSVGCIAYLLGSKSPASAAWLIGISAVLIGLCHVPASMKVRLILVSAAALVLAVFRAGWITAPWPSTIWPLLGAMFMFRLIIYVYDLVHNSAPFSLWRSLAYFFMIPNFLFPLFPVVDYQTFCRTYYNEDPYKIYQTGVKWMIRGGIQLILYRFIYKFMIVGPADIQGASGFFQHMVCTYLLYLQVSGMFHTIVGLLHLFGFNLPEGNHHYVLASSFTDFWRRINIYWKDFMMKVFFYPLFFRLRKLGTTKGMVYATLVTFFITWALHAYQWFWLRGSALFTSQDILFWILLGILVTVSVWNEARPRKKLIPKTTADSVKLAVILARKTVVTFLTITFLWSLWTSDSIGEWHATLLQLRNWNIDAVVKIFGVLALIAVSAIVIGRDQWQVGGAAKLRAANARPYNFWRAAAFNGVLGLFVMTMALSEVQSHMNPSLVAVLDAIENPSLNAADAAEMQRGYYEDLIQVDRFNPELQAMYSKQPKNYFDEWRKKMNTHRDDYLGIAMTPSANMTYEGKVYTTNEWGMRDKPYTKEKPAGVKRIGVIGSSHVMGWGVNDSDVCDTIAEERLNKEGMPYELLNFSVNGYDPIQKTITLESTMLDFNLDAVFIFCHRIEKTWIIDHLVQRVKGKKALPDPFIEEIVKKAGVTPEMDDAVLKIRLSAYGSELLEWSLKKFAEKCREKGIKTAFIFMPEKGRVSFSDNDITELFTYAKEAGYDIIADYSDAYKGYPDKEIQVSDFDDHPNAQAHRLLADRIYETIKSNDAQIGGAPAPAQSATPTPAQ